jgi:hypothetical protein
MSKIQIPSKIRAENFQEEDRAVASGIGAIYNSFVDQLYFLLNGNLDFDNMKRQLVTVTVVMDATGKVTNSPSVGFKLNGRLQGINCIKAQCINNPQQYPTSTPFVSFSLNGESFVITNITGLQANSQYVLTLELIG